MINDACSTSWLMSSSMDSRGSSSGSVENAGPGSLSPPLAAMSRTDYDARNISCHSLFFWQASLLSSVRCEHKPQQETLKSEPPKTVRHRACSVKKALWVKIIFFLPRSSRVGLPNLPGFE